jgi:tetratricopeptide (TPR) repeat protein
MSLNEAKRLYNQGQQKLAAGDLQGAIAKFEQALQFYQKDYLSLTKLAYIMLELKRYEEAIVYCDRLLTIRPNYHEALHIRGIAFYELGQYEQSLVSLNEAQKFRG